MIKQGFRVGVGWFWVESDSEEHLESEPDFFIRNRKSNWIIFYIALLR